MFIDWEYVKASSFITRMLSNPIPVCNVDSSLNEAGSIMDVVELNLRYWNHAEWVFFMVTSLGRQNVIMGHTWLQKHNPDINWTEYFTLPHVFRPDPRGIWVDSGRNGRNGRNLVGISCQWEPTQIWPGLPPNSHQIPTIPTKFTWIHADPSPTKFQMQSNQIPTRFHLESTWIPTKFPLLYFILFY